MKKKPPISITNDMLHMLRSDSPRARLLHRLHSITLVSYGLSASEVARIFGDSPRAVAYWVKRFKQHGLSGLEEESRPGRPSKLNPKQLNKVQTFLKRSEANSKPVSAESLADYIRREFEIGLTPRQCWRILKRLTA